MKQRIFEKHLGYATDSFFDPFVLVKNFQVEERVGTEDFRTFLEKKFSGIFTQLTHFFITSSSTRNFEVEGSRD